MDKVGVETKVFMTVKQYKNNNDNKTTNGKPSFYMIYLDSVRRRPVSHFDE